jgi:polysaccharide deacetylase family protein (PEP-CTERM system associated)
MITNALTVDVEEYYHAAIFRAGTGALGTRNLESRVGRSIDRLLELLQRHAATATFFVLGEIADRHPRMVRQIATAGHEIASHGDRHEDVYRQTPGEFRADIRRAKARIEDVVGGAVVGYRAPNFSISPAQGWAYEVLLEEGLRYDSSLFPIRHDRYGQAGAPRFPFEIWRDGSAVLMEFPIGTVRLFGTNLPIGGGGYFRLLPFALTQLAIQSVNMRERQPVMFYLHPWELDPDQPRPPMAWRHRFRHYVGVAQEAAKLDDLLLRFKFGSARAVLDERTRDAILPINPAWLDAQPQGALAG